MEKNHRLFLRNLPANVTNSDIEENFKNHGTVAKIEIKEKANALGTNHKFAFVNITTTDKKLNTCFQELKNLVINGCKVHIEVAKESFLERLQREREESKAALTPKTETPKTIESINIPHPGVKIALRGTKKNFDTDYEGLSEMVCKSSRKTFDTDLTEVPEMVRKSTKKIFDTDYEEVPRIKTEIKEKAKVIAPDPVERLSTAEQKKKNEADQKRLKSIMERKTAFKLKGGLIREALNAVDGKPLGKKIVFSDDLDSFNEINNQASKGQKRLFDDDDDDEDILDNNDFRVRESVNKKLQTLQSNYGNDKRFALDNRFIDDEDNPTSEKVELCSEIDQEKNWQLDILENVLGKPVKPQTSDDVGFKKTICLYPRKMGMMRYNPDDKDHAMCEIPVTTAVPIKTKKVKQKLAVQNDVDSVQLPDLSKDTFYKVSDNLVDTLKENEQFSLLKTFGTEISSKESPVYEGVREKQGHKFNFSTTDPFKYDSSDNEESEENVADLQKTESKSDWNDSLFFNVDDVRFEDAYKFFNKRSVPDAEFSTRRRELKQIVRSKIQNNLRKKITWKKKKLNRG
ncbi:nucleolar protein 8 isoform X2 [Athalia rosae]|uniref:nucleolar protein 8 isoform X2 n=1 Tax=Athalia rosae TaxID=37344 RepID=UPI0020345CEE|nr:nucleolar protein 8 isoform X2 [Athalia rosae]